MSPPLKDAGKRVMLTRQQEFNRELAAEIERFGASVQQVPVSSVRASHANSGRPLTAEDLSRFSDLIFVSRNAVRFGLEALGKSLRDSGARVLAVGPATGRELAAQGITAVFPETAGGAEDLMGLPQLSDWPDRRVLVVRGEQGREWLKEELERRGAQVEYLPVYRVMTDRLAGPVLQDEVSRSMPDAILVHSTQALCSLLELCAQTGLSISDRPLVVGAHATAEEAVNLGWSGAIVRAASPSNQDMLAALLGFLEAETGDRH